MIAVRIPFFRQEAVIGEFDIVGHQLAPVQGRFVVPFDPLAQVEDIGRVVQLLPAFGQIGLDDEAARRHVAADFMRFCRNFSFGSILGMISLGDSE